MRLTRLGALIILAAGLTLCGAVISGNNLLYLVFSLLTAALLLAAFLNLQNLSRLCFSPSLPDQIFQNKPFSLVLAVHNDKGRPAFQVQVASAGVRRPVHRLEKRGTAEVSLPAVCPRRGRSELAGVTVESGFPFGFFWRRKNIRGLTATAYPEIHDMFGRQASAGGVQEEQVALPRRGVGDEFHGLREYTQGEDSRLINWKLTAKTGKPLVQEYSQPLGRKVTLTVDGTPGRETESRIAECASLAKFYIDAGAEVRLVTNEGESPFGRGLLHLDRMLNSLALLGEGQDLRAPGRPPAGKRTRLVLHQSPWILGLASLTTAVVVGSLLLIEEMSWLTVLPFAAAIPAGWFFDRRRFYPLPKVLFDIAAVLYVLFFMFVDLPASGTLLAVTRLVLFILVYLLCNPKRERQLHQLFLTDFLVFFLVSGQAVSPLYFFFLVLYFMAAFLWLIKWQEEAPALRTSIRPRGLLALTASCFTLSAGLFVLMPRLYSPRMQQFLANTGLSRFQAGLHSLDGLSGQVELGYFGPLRENTMRALRVSFKDDAGRTVRPPFARIRAASFDRFDGNRWSRSRQDFRYRLLDRVFESREGQVRLRNRGGYVAFPGAESSPHGMTEEYFVYPMACAFIFSRGGLGGLETDTPAATIDWTDTANMSSMYAEVTRYRVRSREEATGFYRHIEDYDRILEKKFLQIFLRNERLRELGERIIVGLTNPLAKAEAVEAYLQGRCAYSSAAEHGRQTVDEFLFRTRAGNCEYFATAMCLLLRHIGIPSRLAIGFLSDGWNEYGQFFDVRQSDAHAWVEAYIPGRGWVTFDPTPPGFSQEGPAGFLGRLLRRVRNYFSALEVRWYRYVVGYDRTTQRNIYGRIQLTVSRNLVRILIGLGALVGTILLLRSTKPWRLIRQRRLRRERRDHFYYGLLEALERKGFSREPSRTGREFAAEVAGDRPELEPLRGITEMFYAVRYAGRTLSPEETTEVERSASLLLQVLRKA